VPNRTDKISQTGSISRGTEVMIGAGICALVGQVGVFAGKVRLMTRIAFSFKSPDALIALAMLSLGGHKPVLPGRS
jgi:hypothetical protein